MPALDDLEDELARVEAARIERVTWIGRVLARKILDAMPRAARAPPSVDSTVAYEPAFA
jgi:hypothetical protein